MNEWIDNNDENLNTKTIKFPSQNIINYSIIISLNRKFIIIVFIFF